jgi:hypothetical protein
MNSRLLLQLLVARPRGGRQDKDGGFALLLALFVAFTVMLGWLALANRSNSSSLGAALQGENREARITAESGLAVVIDELNRPANRMILAKGQMIGTTPNSALTNWDQPVATGSPLINPCANVGVVNPEAETRPSALATTLGSGNSVPLANGGANDGVTRQFRLVGYRLKNADRSTGAAYEPDQVNLQPDRQNQVPKRGVGYLEVTVEGQLLRDRSSQGLPPLLLATSRVTQELQVVPKCCNRSFRGPGDPTRASEKTDDGVLPGIYGDDNRFCFDDFPPMMLGVGNREGRNDGGLFTVLSTPNIRTQENPNERPIKVFCYSTQSRCSGDVAIDGVPVVATNQTPPTVPVLSADGIPCDDDDLDCKKKGILKAKTLSARSIELTNAVNGGAKSNSATDKYAKDYVRVNGKNVEICNKKYSTDADTAATANRFDTSPEIVTGSCEILYDDRKPNDSKNVCARQEIDGFVSYHCRIRNIYVNDFDADGEASVRANNTLFIDTTGNPETPNPRINFHINEDWAKTRLDSTDPNDALIRKEMSEKNGLSPSGFRSIYTVGGYNDGQIQHVNCGVRSSADQACLTPADPKISTRAAIISACERAYNQVKDTVEDTCERDKRTSRVFAEVGDDGYMRGLFLFAPFSNVTVYGDPTVDTGWDQQDLDQGRPQIAAAVWAHRLRFVSRTTEIYVPGRNAEFFGFETSWDDRYAPHFSFDYVARGITGQSLFSLSK